MRKVFSVLDNSKEAEWHVISSLSSEVI